MGSSGGWIRTDFYKAAMRNHRKGGSQVFDLLKSSLGEVDFDKRPGWHLSMRKPMKMHAHLVPRFAEAMEALKAWRITRKVYQRRKLGNHPHSFIEYFFVLNEMKVPFPSNWMDFFPNQNVNVTTCRKTRRGPRGKKPKANGIEGEKRKRKVVGNESIGCGVKGEGKEKITGRKRKESCSKEKVTKEKVIGNTAKGKRTSFNFETENLPSDQNSNGYGHNEREHGNGSVTDDDLPERNHDDRMEQGYGKRAMTDLEAGLVRLGELIKKMKDGDS